MFGEWTSLSEKITKNIDFAQEKTTLKCFSLTASKEITGILLFYQICVG